MAQEALTRILELMTGTSLPFDKPRAQRVDRPDRKLSARTTKKKVPLLHKAAGEQATAALAAAALSAPPEGGQAASGSRILDAWA